jgi:hypothetical protein
MRWSFLLCGALMACSRPTAPTTTVDSGTITPPSSSAPLAGATVRAALDPIGQCAAAPGIAITNEHPWSRNGGLLHRTYVRGRMGADLSLSLVFPSGPDGPSDVTGGFARFTASQGSVVVYLLVAVSATGATERAYLSVTIDSVELAQLPFTPPTFATITTPTTLEAALDAAIEQRHTLTPAQLATKTVCIVLPASRPGVPGRGQECHQEPTTAIDRTNAEADAKAATAREEAQVKTNLALLTALVAETYPYANASCTARLAP